MSLFDLGTLQEIERGDEKKKTLRVSTCESCGLSASCHTPKAGYTGQGKKKILLITGAMTSHEDKEENRLRSSMFHFLRRAMKEYANIDIEEDCWHTHAIRCYSREHTRDDNYTNATFSACHRMLMREIEELKPSIIVPLNSKAWQVLLWGRMVGRASHDSFYDYAGEVIPDQVLKTWIAPVYDPEIVKIQDEKQINKFRLFWGQQFNRILVYANKPVPTADISGIRIAHTPEQALELLRDVETWKAFAFDYEATGLKPHKDWHHITHISFSNGKEAYGMPYFEKNRDFIKQICKILTNSAIKVAHNASYERSWSLNIEGIEVNNLCHDPMLGQHSLHNQKPANLKFLGYSRYGILGYDAAVDEFMKASTEDEKKWRCNAKNNMEHAPISKTSTYCAEDSLITFWLYQDIILRDLDKRNQYPGYAFFMEAQKALDAAHERGMVVDMEYLDKVQPELEQRMQAVYMRIMDNPLITRRWDWKTFKPSSDAHVRHLIYDILKCEPFEFTESNLPSVDIDTLYTFVKDCDLIPDLLEYRKLGKIINTYFGQFRGEEVDGLIRPYFKLHGVKTFRSACVAKGTKILVNRDYESHPEGVPIEDIREGDMVFCYDDNLKPTLRPVLWAGKTGHERVVRIHFNKGKGSTGYLDVTPEHRIRLVNGDYVRADELMGDFRDRADPRWKWQPKCRVLSLRRELDHKGDRLWATGTAQGVLEHRFVWETVTGESLGDLVIHHKDGNHRNHEFSNLEKMTNNQHVALHYTKGVGIDSEESRRKNREIIMELHRQGKYSYLSGPDSPIYKKVDRSACIRRLVEARGKPVKVPMDFDTFKKKCTEASLSIKDISIRYNSEGDYLPKNKIIRLLGEIGFSKTYASLKIGYATLKKLCEIYGIGYDRQWANKQDVYHERRITVNNHTVTSIEYIDTPVDVYDLTIEEFPNFIANEVCVHNSASPNFQNISKRDKEAKRVIRSALKTIPGHRIIEYDFKSMEVSIAAAVSGDPMLIKYVTDLSTDMHYDCAMDLFFLPRDKIAKPLRNDATKGPFVFAEFYGSYWKQVAKGVWDEINIPDAEKKFSLDIMKHLYNNGVKTYEDWEEHVKEQERILWEERFPIYKAFREKTYDSFCKNGFINYPNGFRYYGPASKNEVLNAPVQGPAFHIQLWAFTQVTEELKKRKMKSYLFGQIHDAMVASVAPEEEDWMDYLIWDYATQKVREHWNWITVPLMVEKERSKIITKTEGSWADMEACGFVKGN